MNYNEIKEKYPKAWTAFVNWGFAKSFFSKLLFGGINKFEETIMSNSKPNRELYDFFDETKEVLVDVTWKFENIIPIWGYTVYEIKNNEINSKYDFQNRKEAEKAAFIKAFEILEQKL